MYSSTTYVYTYGLVVALLQFYNIFLNIYTVLYAGGGYIHRYLAGTAYPPAYTVGTGTLQSKILVLQED